MESAGSITITASRSGGTSGAVGVSYVTFGGTATSSLFAFFSSPDYTFMFGTLSWAGGDSADKTFSVPILNNDGSPEGTETFTVFLFSPTGGASLGSPSSTSVTIIND